MRIAKRFERGVAWKILSILLSAVLVVSFVPVLPTKAYAEGQPTVTVSTPTNPVEAGGNVTLDVTMSNIPSFSTYGFEVGYDSSVLTLTTISKGTLSTDGLFTSNTTTGKIGFACSDADIQGPTGTLFCLTFSVNASASSGNTSVSLGLGKDGCFKKNGSKDDVNATFVPATVTVQGSTPTVPEVTGGSTISEDGTYQIAASATGKITVNEGVTATVKGKGDTETFGDLYFDVKNGSTLTLQDVRISNTSAATDPIVSFNGEGSLNAEGVNVLEYDNGGGEIAVINVDKNDTVTFGGSGMLYGYKTSLATFIGGNKDQSNGAMTFGSGTWLIKGSKTGAVIGAGEKDEKGGSVTIDGANVYVYANAMAAGIGASANGSASKVPNINVKSGMLTAYTNWYGAAIGAAGKGSKGSQSIGDPAGSLAVTGGSARVLVGSNAYSGWGITSTNAMVPWEPAANVASKKNGAGVDVAMLAFDTTSYASQQSITVKVDDVAYYTGAPAYAYQPDASAKSTIDTWKASSDANLYFWLTKETHTITVGQDTVTYYWDATNKCFTTENPDAKDYQWYINATGDNYTISSAADLAAFANIVNGTAPASLKLTKDDFSGKTVTLAGNIALTGEWNPIGGNPQKTDLTISSQDDLTAAIAQYGVVYDSEGNSHNGGKHDTGYKAGLSYFYYKSGVFKGTFDGAGKSITGLSITTGTGGYKGLFGNNAGTIKNLSIAGAITLSSGADCNGGLVGYNAGTVSGISGNVAVTVSSSSMYGNGGIVGENHGKIEKCSNAAAVTGAKATGGICGRNYSLTSETEASINECVNTGAVTGTGKGKDQIGGIVGGLGYKENTAGTFGAVVNCYNTGSVNNASGRWFGGIAGFATQLTTITGCYNTGTIGNPYSGGGGLIAYMDSGSIANSSNNYALEQSGYTGTSLNGTALTTDQLKSKMAVLALNGEGSAFNMDAATPINGGYPVLAWQGGTAVAAGTLSVDAIADQTYTGSAIEPTVVVKDGSDVLWTSFYTVEYSNNTEAGQATAAVTGAGAYANKNAAANFKIIRSISDATIAVDDQEYTGSPIVPQDAIVSVGGKTLVKGTDYTIGECSNNTNLTDAANITINGMGFYSESAAGTFKIVAATTFVIENIDDQTFTGSQITPTVVVKSKEGKTLTLGTDYTVSYGQNINAGSGSVSVTGINNYSGTKSKNFVIAQKSIALAQVSAASQTYTSEAIVPTSATVAFDGGATLVQGTDFTIGACSDNVNAGTATISVLGKGNYTGTATGSFEIAAADFAGATISGIEKEYKYTGHAIEPVPTVTLNGKVLPASDYAVTYEDNTDMGTATVIVMPEAPNMTGDAQEIEFTIVKPDEPQVIGGEDQVWTKGSGQPVVFSSDAPFATFSKVRLDGTELTKDVDYTVTEGSTIVTVNAAVMEKLGAGNHTLEIVSDFGDGKEHVAKFGFTVENAKSSDTANVAKTGDSALPIALAVVALCAAAGCLVVARRRLER